MASHQIRDVVRSTVELVREQLRAKWGSLDDCCTDATLEIYRRLKDGIELTDEFFVPTMERIEGRVATVDGTYRHEWIRIDGIDYDPTAEQFTNPVYSDEHVIDW